LNSQIRDFVRQQRPFHDSLASAGAGPRKQCHAFSDLVIIIEPKRLVRQLSLRNELQQLGKVIFGKSLIP
jgi:hypothetical protein